MPNFFSAFTNDAFRPLATLLIPGVIGISTWFVALMWQFPKLHDLVTQNHTESGFVLFLVTVFAGIVLEDIGARWEFQLDAWADERTKNEHGKNWVRYLQTAFKSDPVGRRYARTLVLRLKFELGTAFAMVCAALGLIWLATLGLGFWATSLLELLCFVFTVWPLKEAKDTHKVLSKTRAILLGDIRVVE